MGGLIEGLERDLALFSDGCQRLLAAGLVGVAGECARQRGPAGIDQACKFALKVVTRARGHADRSWLAGVRKVEDVDPVGCRRHCGGGWIDVFAHQQVPA